MHIYTHIRTYIAQQYHRDDPKKIIDKITELDIARSLVGLRQTYRRIAKAD